MDNNIKNQLSQNGHFTSKIGFILASVGSAVGMGNIWMFPYRVGQYGGAAFFIPYFLFVALFGLVGLSGEFALGRKTGTGPVGSFEQALASRGKKGGAKLGYLPLAGSFGIAIGYCIVVGWILRSIFGALSGKMFSMDAEIYFHQATGAFGSIPWHLAVVVITAAILLLGITNGIEKINRFMMPAFFILFLIIAVRVFFLPGSLEGYRYLLLPKWEALLQPKTWIMAMGQAFFSLSITGSGMIIYGSYLKPSEDIIHSSALTALLDTFAALISGFAIIPAVFAFGLDPQSGPSLLFITLPRVFEKMPMGRIFAIFFFISVLFAGITSLLNMFEVCTEALQTRFHAKRLSCVLIVSTIIFVVGLFIEYMPYMGQWMDTVTIFIVPIGALLGAVIIYWVFGLKTIKEELMKGRNKPLPKCFDFLAKYLYIFLSAAVVILGILLGGIG